MNFNWVEEITEGLIWDIAREVSYFYIQHVCNDLRHLCLRSSFIFPFFLEVLTRYGHSYLGQNRLCHLSAQQAQAACATLNIPWLWPLAPFRADSSQLTSLSSSHVSKTPAEMGRVPQGKLDQAEPEGQAREGLHFKVLFTSRRTRHPCHFLLRPCARGCSRP